MNRVFSALVALGLITGAAVWVAGVASPSEASAQTATKLRCKGCVGARQLGKKAVKSKHISPGAITSLHIQDGTIAPNDLAATAKPTAVAASELRTEFGIALAVGADTKVLEVTIHVPGPGAVTAMYSVDGHAVTVPSRIACTVDVPGTSLTNSFYNVFSFATVGQYATLNGVRAFPVATEGDVTLDLICREVASDVSLGYPGLVLQFAPNAGSLVSESAAAPEIGSSSALQ